MTEYLKKANDLTAQLEQSTRLAELSPYEGAVYLGVDIGTANVVTVAVGEAGLPLAGVVTPARVTREGIVVDYIKAVKIVREQVAAIKDALKCEFSAAMSAVPPGTESGNEKVTRNILEAADLNVIGLIDEPEAAALVLGLKDGVVVDVGGGTTGVSVIENGTTSYSVDEPTGGFQFDLVIAGHFSISVQEAEGRKRDPEQSEGLFPVVRPVMEKVGTIVKKALKHEPCGDIYLVGGSCAFPGFPRLLEREIGTPVWLPDRPLLVTPLGIALACRNKSI